MRNLKILILALLASGLLPQAFAQDFGDAPFGEPRNFGGQNFGGGRGRWNGGNFPQRRFQQNPENAQPENSNIAPVDENVDSISEIQDEMTEVDNSGFVGQARRERNSRIEAFKNQSPEEALLENLMSRNPFGGSDKPAEKSGVMFTSAIKMDGEWNFGFTLKDGRSIFLKQQEQIEGLPCQVVDFDEEAVLVKIKIEGREEVLPITQVQFGGRRVELVAGLQVRDRPPSPDERREIWNKFATDEERSAANNIFNAARAEGRRMNRNDFRRLREIEQNIQTRRNSQQQQQGRGRQ